METKSARETILENLKKMFEEAELQVALGKAEAYDAFEKQKKKILEEIRKLETEIKNNPRFKEIASNLREELEKFKSKLEDLVRQFQSKKEN